MKTKRAKDIFEQHFLIIHSYDFACPYCGRTVPRGGKAEGFRKAGFAHHVYACWEIGLYLRGYLITDGGFGPSRNVVALADVDMNEPWRKRFLRSIKANMRKRKLDGTLHLLEPR